MKENWLLQKNEQEVNLMPPLVWAYIGDSIFEVYIRTYLVNKTKSNTNKLHKEAIKYVSAKAQSNILFKILDYLNDQEKDIVRRARNSQSHHLPKNTQVKDYMYSTAFEALIGYLYLTKQEKRLEEILNLSIS